MMTLSRTFVPITGAVALAACSPQSSEDQMVEEAVEASPSPDAPVSIIRPDVEQPELPEPALEPLNVTLGFPEGGSDLDADAMAALEQILASEQLASGAPIVLRAHSDSGGTDKSNADASEARGLVVAEWLIGKGVNQERIDVIVFGEQNPAEPNALPDGSPNEAGRAANRRVEVLIVPPVPADAEKADEEPESESSAAVSD